MKFIAKFSFKKTAKRRNYLKIRKNRETGKKTLKPARFETQLATFYKILRKAKEIEIG